MGGQEIDRESILARMRQKKWELHELPYTEIVNSGTIRLASVYSAKHMCTKITHIHYTIIHTLFTVPLHPWQAQFLCEDAECFWDSTYTISCLSCTYFLTIDYREQNYHSKYISRGIYANHALIPCTFHNHALIPCNFHNHALIPCPFHNQLSISFLLYYFV